MNAPIDLIVFTVQNSDECIKYLTETYPYEFEVWTRFSSKNGTNCTFARAALKQIFSKEIRTEEKCLVKMIMSNHKK